MISLRTLALASALGLLTVGTASAITARAPMSPTASHDLFETHAIDGYWNADASGIQTGRSVHHEAQAHPMHHHRMLHHATRHNRVHADGHCNGRSHGTGDLSCGTATGGPSGGNANRN